MIVPSHDRYGAEAERSHLADWLELLALAGSPLGAAKLADHLRDTNWTVRSRELFYDRLEDEPTEDDQEGGAGIAPPDEVADQILAMIESRLEGLGPDLYPFSVVSGVPVLRDALKDSHRPYLVLLAITVAHHYSVATTEVPEQVFEVLLADVMRSRGLVTCDLGTTGRLTKDFRETVRHAGDEISLIADENGAPSRKWANDEGIDTISHLDWGDLRPGHWLYIGQATIGASNTWATKILQPAPAQWRGLMTSSIDPVSYLAIPHHAEDEHLHFLTTKHARLVLDRMRLARHMVPPIAGSPADSILECVLAEGVFDPRV